MPKEISQSMRTYRYLSAMCALITFVAAVSCNDDSNTPTPPPSAPTDFEFVNVRVSETGFALDIIPEDKSMEYIVLISEKSYFKDNGITTSRDLLDDDYIYFQHLAEQYGVSVRDFLTTIGWLLTDDTSTYKGLNLYPATEYVVYCYGVEFDGDHYDVITPINHTIVTTETPEMFDVSLSVSSTVDGNVATLEFDPADYEGLYFAYLFERGEEGYLEAGSSADEEYTAFIRNMAYGEFRYLIQDQVKAPEEFCMQGKRSAEMRLMANSDYMVALFAVNDDSVPLLCSTPVLYHFATNDIAFTDMTIDITISDITPYTAELALKPSDKRAPYAAVLIKADGYDKFPTDEIERMFYIMEYIKPAIFTGNFSETMLPLMPGEEYVVVAFGCDKEQPTTHLFEERFYAAEAQTGDITLDDVKLHKVFDVEQIVALDSSYAYLLNEYECMVYVEAVTSAPCDKIYYWWYDGFMKEEYEYEAFLEDLILYGITPSPCIMGLWYNFEFFFAGLAEDNDGDLSDIYFGEIDSIKPSDCSPAEEFFTYIGDSELLSTAPSIAAKSLVIR